MDIQGTTDEPSKEAQPSIKLSDNYGVLIEAFDNEKIAINNEYISMDNMISTLEEIISKKNKKKAFLRTNADLRFGSIINVLLNIKESSIREVTINVGENKGDIFDVILPIESTGDYSKILSSPPGDYTPIEIPDSIGPKDIIVLTLGRGGVFYINTEQASDVNYIDRLKMIYADRPQKVIYLRADSMLSMNEIYRTINAIQQVGISVFCVILELFTI
jgi:biopolymer transport protein ExbD